MRPHDVLLTCFRECNYSLTMFFSLFAVSFQSRFCFFQQTSVMLPQARHIDRIESRQLLQRSQMKQLQDHSVEGFLMLLSLNGCCFFLWTVIIIVHLFKMMFALHRKEKWSQRQISELGNFLINVQIKGAMLLENRNEFVCSIGGALYLYLHMGRQQLSG